jgi:methylated-DNA-[protein]-cysteine S-methyltransferase
MADVSAPKGVSPAKWAQCTEFEQLVYRAAARIPKGVTRTYRWVAKTIGRPRAVRAVGNALSRNPFMPAVPCHRVVRSDGRAGGYAGGGPARKLALLRREGCAALPSA